MSSAFARLVESGFYDEDEIPPILHQILHDTPRDLYDLGPRAGEWLICWSPRESEIAPVESTTSPCVAAREALN